MTLPAGRLPLRRSLPILLAIGGWLALTGCQTGAATPAVPPDPSQTVPPATGTATLPPPTHTSQPFQVTAVQQATPTRTSMPAWVTIILPTEAPSATVTPSEGAGAGTASPTPTRTPYPTTTPPPPSPQLVVQSPGPYSKVVSPIQLRAVIHPGDDKVLYLDLIGEDGRVIVSQLYNFSLATEYWIYTIQEIPFTIGAFSEAARLVLYTLDQHNRKIYQVSVDLILLQMGDDSLNVPMVENEPYVIRKPWEGGTVRGGVMEVEGLARPLNDQPLIIEIIDEQGNTVGSGEVAVEQPSALQPYMPFTLELPYSVSKWTRVRFSARQESATRIPGTIWLTSFLMYVEP